MTNVRAFIQKWTRPLPSAIAFSLLSVWNAGDAFYHYMSVRYFTMAMDIVIAGAFLFGAILMWAKVLSERRDSL